MASTSTGYQGDDEVILLQRPRKRPRIIGRSDRGRRRLRCHFYAKSPFTQTEKECVFSGWLSMHNLRGHHDIKHTRIRCNKCFQEFETKPPKNQHQRNCTLNSLPPTMDVIDCDKTDEIEDISRTFRTWRLDREEDVVMKDWILKYKEEFVSSNIPADDDHDCRELARWYHMWCILFPSHEGPVPSPFQNASISPSDIKVERLLEVFQATVQAKVASDQHPPAELGPQIGYYTDVIRTVLKHELDPSFRYEPDLSFEPSMKGTASSGSVTSYYSTRSIARTIEDVSHWNTNSSSDSVQRNNSFHLTMGGAQPQFVANNLAGSYSFAEGHQSQGNQNWSEVQMGQIRFSQSLHCGSCSDSGLWMQNGQMVQCPCGIFSGLQT